VKVDTRVIKKVLYGIDPCAHEDPEFVENVNIWILLMEKEQKKQNKKKKSANKLGEARYLSYIYGVNIKN